MDNHAMRPEIHERDTWLSMYLVHVSLHVSFSLAIQGSWYIENHKLSSLAGRDFVRADFSPYNQKIHFNFSWIGFNHTGYACCQHAPRTKD
jgi:hypothetical protein